MNTILVTGSKGQLARCIKDLTKSFNNDTFIFTDVEELDITDSALVDSFFQQNQIDYCINCAAYTAVDKAETETELAYAVNAKGAENLAITCAKNNTTLIHISTDFIFDGNKNTSYLETDKPNPLSVYGKSKLDGELRIQKKIDQLFIIRTSWLYSEYGANFLKTMLRLGKEKTTLSVVSDQIGSPTYAKDLAYTILKLIEKQSVNYGIYHYSNQGKTSWYGFAKAIFEIQDINIQLNSISTEGYPTPAKRPIFSELNTLKIREELNITIPYWKESLKTAIKNLEKH